MKLDLRQPTLVIAGAWNPAIFSLEWIATSLLGKKENDTVKFTQVLDAVGNNAVYFDEIGIGASSDRLKIYCNAIQQAEAAEKMSTKILELLSHTPITGVGVNFVFFQESCDAGIVDKIQTREDIAKHRRIISQRFVTAIEIEPKLTLNFDRTLSAGNVSFNFNYHHAAINAETAREKVGGSIERCHKDALDFLSQIYGIGDAETPIQHQFQS